MPKRSCKSWSCSFLLLLCAGACAQEQVPKAYTIPVEVYEVNLTFSASNFDGTPLEDLGLPDLRLLDNGKQQKRIVRFQYRRGLALRAGILVDTSRSMLGDSLIRNRSIANSFASRILRSGTDQAFVTEFDFAQMPLQGWTSKTEELQTSMQRLGKNAKSRLGGTALWDSVYRTVRDRFGELGNSAVETGNVILLFTDGNDNVSHAYLKDVVDICQQTRTSVYAFADAKKSRFDEGEKNLAALASQTGGRVFYLEATDHTAQDLREIEAKMRNSYLIGYRPSDVKKDGKFHLIKLTSPTRGGVFDTRSGYYAPGGPV
jgi:VWFA-related protein